MSVHTEGINKEELIMYKKQSEIKERNIWREKENDVKIDEQPNKPSFNKTATLDVMRVCDDRFIVGGLKPLNILLKEGGEDGDRRRRFNKVGAEHLLDSCGVTSRHQSRAGHVSGQIWSPF